jgi:outer membrane protein assembly factor BamE
MIAVVTQRELVTYIFNYLETLVVKLNRKMSLGLLLLSLVSCGSIEFPGVYKLTVQQGNIVSQEMIDKLKPGMTRAQIQFVLGNPVLADSFDSERWNYIYTIAYPDQPIIKQELIIVFENDRLIRFEGDYVPSSANTSDQS